MVIVARVWDRSLWVWIGVGFLWVVVQVGGFPSCHVVGCSYSWVSPGRRVFKIPFVKRPKTRVKVLWIYALCGVGFFLFQVWFGRGWGVRGVRCWVSSDCVLLDGVYLLRNWGWGHGLLVLGLWVTGW